VILRGKVGVGAYTQAEARRGAGAVASFQAQLGPGLRAVPTALRLTLQ
jgi:hypothetical protein